MNTELVNGKKPIIYEYEMDIRFSDLDCHGHLNVKNYLDLVISSRFLYLARVLKTPISEFTGKDIGFYTSKSYQEYLRPVIGLRRLKIKSFVEKAEKSRLTVPYEIMDSDKSMIFSKGYLEFAVINMKTQKSVEEIPDWVFGYFLT